MGPSKCFGQLTFNQIRKYDESLTVGLIKKLVSGSLCPVFAFSKSQYDQTNTEFVKLKGNYFFSGMLEYGKWLNPNVYENSKKLSFVYMANLEKNYFEAESAKISLSFYNRHNMFS
jgi:hypothetical protein